MGAIWNSYDLQNRRLLKQSYTYHGPASLGLAKNQPNSWVNMKPTQQGHADPSLSHVTVPTVRQGQGQGLTSTPLALAELSSQPALGSCTHCPWAWLIPRLSPIPQLQISAWRWAGHRCPPRHLGVSTFNWAPSNHLKLPALLFFPSSKECDGFIPSSNIPKPFIQH